MTSELVEQISITEYWVWFSLGASHLWDCTIFGKYIYTYALTYIYIYIYKRLHIGHSRTTHSYLLEAKQQPMYHACQAKYTEKHILIKYTDPAHIREIFYSANDMKELFQKIQMKNVMSFLKAINVHGNVMSFLKAINIYGKNLKEFSARPNFSYKLFFYKKYFSKIWSFPQAVP